MKAGVRQNGDFYILQRDAMHAVYAVMRCPSVRLVLQSGSHTILVFPHQTGWQYSDENPANGGVECRLGRQKSRI